MYYVNWVVKIAVLTYILDSIKNFKSSKRAPVMALFVQHLSS